MSSKVEELLKKVIDERIELLANKILEYSCDGFQKLLKEESGRSIVKHGMQGIAIKAMNRASEKFDERMKVLDSDKGE